MELAADYALDGSYAVAATQGVEGLTSTGSVHLSVTKTTAARITGLSDMSVSWNSASSDITWTSDVCVYSTHASGNYTVTAIGSAKAGGAFIMGDGEKKLPYNVLWNAGGAGNLSDKGVSLQPNVPSAVMGKAATTSSSCRGTSGGPTARLIINIPQVALQAATVGNYADSLTLVVAPD